MAWYCAQKLIQLEQVVFMSSNLWIWIGYIWRHAKIESYISLISFFRITESCSHIYISQNAFRKSGTATPSLSTGNVSTNCYSARASLQPTTPADAAYIAHAFVGHPRCDVTAKQRCRRRSSKLNCLYFSTAGIYQLVVWRAYCCFCIFGLLLFQPILPPRPHNYLPLSVCIFLCINWPFGLIALIFSCKCADAR